MTLDQWRAKGAVYRHRGEDIFFVDEGEGPALICIHGFPTSSWDWHAVWPALTARYRVIAADMIGFGFSAKPRHYRYSLFDQADLWEGLLNQLGVDRVYVLAHDYGDTVAQELLHRFNVRTKENASGPMLNAVCLLNGGIFMDIANPRPIQKLLKSPLGFVVARLLNERRFHRSFARIFGPDTQPTAEELSGYWSCIDRNHGRRVIHKVIRYMNERMTYRDRWTEALQNAQCPVRLVVGAHDPISGLNIAEHFEDVVPDADVIRLDSCGHYPQVEAPDDVIAATLSVFER